MLGRTCASEKNFLKIKEKLNCRKSIKREEQKRIHQVRKYSSLRKIGSKRVWNQRWSYGGFGKARKLFGGKMDKYINKSIKINREITYQRIINLCISEKNYCLYENRNEISLGTGKYLELCIKGNLIKIISDAGIKEEIEINDFCTDLETALDTIDLQNWRLYGIANSLG